MARMRPLPAFTLSEPLYRRSLAAGKGTIEDLARMRPFYSFKLSDTLQPVCSALGSGSNIVGVVDDQGDLLRVVTQGALIRVLEPLEKPPPPPPPPFH